MILGLIEHENGTISNLSLEMLTLGRRLADQLGAPLEVLSIGGEASALAERLSDQRVAALHLCQHERLDAYAPEAWARCVAQQMETLKPQVVMAAGSERGSEVMAHVAAWAGLPMAANVVDAQAADPFVVTRLRWGGSLLEEARLKAEVKLLTTAPNALPVGSVPPAAAIPVHPVTPSLSDQDFRVRVVERVASGAGKISLGEARLVVGGGRGVGSAEGFKTLEELAELLGGAVGCSRAVTSNGWRPHMDQIGQTGTRITAELYIACGVSGATQHIVGCKAAKRILAVNTDPDASIMAHADYAVIGDLHEVIPALVAEVKRVRGG